MAIDLIKVEKGQRVDLTKGTNLEEVLLGLGWDINRFAEATGKNYDLDLVLFMCKSVVVNPTTGEKKDLVIDDDHFVFYKQQQDPAGSVKLSKDNVSGKGEGDDETAIVNFAKVPAEVEKIVIAVTIYDANAKGQNFGDVENAYIRILDNKTGDLLKRYDLSEDCSTETSMVFGELYRHNGEWKFKAVGNGFKKELIDLCREYGVDV